MSSNRTFFKKVNAGKMTLKDIFSETLKKHTPEQTANVFMAGTPLTTPSEADMLANWQKPFLFFRFLCGGLVTVLLLFILYHFVGHTPAAFMIIILLPFFIVTTWLILVWEMNIPRNISIYEVFLYVAVGGALSILATIIISIPVNLPSAIWAPLTEEPAKLLVIYLILRKKDYKYMISGILIGVAVGTGFAVLEDWQYGFNKVCEDSIFGAIDLAKEYSLGSKEEVWSAFYAARRAGVERGLTNAFIRSLNSIGSHGLYSGLYGGGLVLAKGGERVQLKHLTDTRFLYYFGAACGLHALNNSDFLFNFDLPVLFGSFYSGYILVQAIAVAVFLPCLRKGVNQAVEIAAAHNGGRVTMAVQRGQSPVIQGAGYGLEAISGPLAGQVFPVRGTLTLGRKPENDICLPGCGQVSGIHCRITAGNSGVVVTDLGSTNGTFLGETRVSPNQPTPVPVGTVIFLGGKSCGFRVTG